ncbi:MAG: hypothetical protein JO166_07445 [Deltaproteobacteria bacterium]|nr:hypothetical protein [Deltaproteobacteria bacterium]
MGRCSEGPRGGGAGAVCSLKRWTQATRIEPATRLVIETPIIALKAMGEWRQRMNT